MILDIGDTQLIDIFTFDHFFPFLLIFFWWFSVGLLLSLILIFGFCVWHLKFYKLCPLSSTISTHFP